MIVGQSKTKSLVKYSNFIYCIVILLLQNICHSQTITLEEALGAALKNNEDLTIQQNNLNVSLLKVKEAYASLLPSINGFGQFQKRKGGQFIEQQAQFVNDALTDNFFGSLDANIILFNGFKNINTISQSKHTKNANNQGLERTKQDIVFQVSTLYLDCLIKKELAGIFQNNINTQKNILEKIEEESRLGVRPEIDLLLQKSEVEKMNLELLKAKGQLKNVKLRLADLIGIDPTSEFDIIEPLKLSNQVDNSTNLDSASIDYSKRADYLKSLSEIDAAKNGKKIESSGSLPNLSAFYSYNSGYNSGFLNDFSRQIDDNLLNEYGIRLNIPIFNGLKNSSAKKQAEANYANAQLTNQKLKRQIKQEILNAQQAYKEAFLNKELAKKQLEYAEQVFALETERLDLGMSDVERFSRATEAIVQSRSTMIQAKYTLLFQKVFLEYALGTLSI